MNNSIFLYISKEIQIYISSNPHQFAKKKREEEEEKVAYSLQCPVLCLFFLIFLKAFSILVCREHLYTFFIAVLYSIACPYHDFFNQSPTGEHSAYFNMFAIIHKGISFKTFKNTNR